MDESGAQASANRVSVALCVLRGPPVLRYVTVDGAVRATGRLSDVADALPSAEQTAT